MLLEDLVGIMDLNASANLYQASMTTLLHFSLQQVLLCFVQLSNGHRLFAEVQQSNEVMGWVQAVIPNTPEAEQMVLMTNKNFPAYIGNALRDQGLPNDFLLELLKRSYCPTLVLEMASCTWDSDFGILTTQWETNKNKHLDKLEKAAWFKDAFEDLVPATKGGPKRPTPPPKTLFELDGERLVKTIHQHNKKSQPFAGSTPPARKTGTRIINLMASDEDSTSSSSDKGLRSAASDGDAKSPSLSDKDNGQAPGATNGG